MEGTGRELCEQEDNGEELFDEEEEDCPPDPRVKEELDILNQASMDVNRLENELNEARTKYRSTFTTASQKMEELGAKIKKSIQRARQYFELSEKAKEAQSEAVRAARQYQTANGVYKAAKETIALAELRLMDDDSQSASLSAAWQEMLNHATVRVMEAEREKTHSEAEHHRRAAVYAEIEAHIHQLEKKYKRSIAKARPYFETKASLELRLQQLKQNVWDLQQAIGSSKARYASALHALETISEEIHESRRNKLLLMFPREPGVGAESDSVGSSISDANIEKKVFPMSGFFTGSTTGGDEDEESGPEEDGDDVFSSSGDAHARPRLHEQLSGVSSGFGSESSYSESVTSSEGQCCSPVSSPATVSFPITAAVSADKDCHTSVSTCSATTSRAAKGGSCAGRQNSAESDFPSEVSGMRMAGDGSPTKDLCNEVLSGAASSVAGQHFVAHVSDSLSSLSTAHDSDADSGVASALSDSDLKTKVSGSVDSSSVQSAPRKTKDGQSDPKKSSDPNDKPTTTQEPAQQVTKLPLKRTDCGRNHRSLQGVMLLNPSDLASTTFKF